MQGMLIFFCGKMGSGKSTKSVEMTGETGAVLISEDDWLSRLYPAEIKTFEDYLSYSARLKSLVKSHVQSLLGAGVTVIMDFPGNTRKQRAWFREMLHENACRHRLIYLKATDELCLSRLARRRESHPERAAFDNEAVFRQVTRYFEVPSVDEGFNLETVEQ